jgi:mucolipin 3
MKTLELLRVLLHGAACVLLTSRSSQLGTALHPFQRALANDWVRLLFYVDTRGETLPHFLLEKEEEVAANVDDEFFDGGFAARASAMPVGALFTIDETRLHVHGAVANYFRLADEALDAFLVFGNETQLLLPPPLLTVRKDVAGQTLDRLYNITNGSVSEQWPAPLRTDGKAARQQETRQFFDELDAMEMRLVVGMKRKERLEEGGPATDRLYEWTVVIRYDLLNQGHLEVTMNYHLVHVPLLEDGRRAEEEDDMPPALADTSVVLTLATLMVVCLYQVRCGEATYTRRTGRLMLYGFLLQAVELSLKWAAVKAVVAQHADREGHVLTTALRRGAAGDFWFWFVLAVNFATVVVLLAAWRHAFRLSLNDTLCFAFASCCALQWGGLVRYLQANARFHILGLTLRRGFPRVVQFLVGVLPIFIGFVLFGTVMFGAKVPRFQSASGTATTLFSVANGDEIHDTFNDVAYTPWIGQMYVYSYMILFSYVVLMVCIGIIEDAFFSAVFPASWPTLEKTQGEGLQSAGAGHHRHP